MEQSFQRVDVEPQTGTIYFTPSNLPSVGGTAPPTPSRQSSITNMSTLSAMAQMSTDEFVPPISGGSFNVLFAGESGLGKTSFERNFLAHLDPTKLQNFKKNIADALATVAMIDEEIRRNEQESRQCNDERARSLRTAKIELKERQAQAQGDLDEKRRLLHQHQLAVEELNAEVRSHAARVEAQRAQSREEEDDAEAHRLIDAVISGEQELSALRARLEDELRRSNLDRKKPQGQTTEVTARLIASMPLYTGADKSVDVTLIDTPGYGDNTIDTPDNSSADRVVAEVERRITSHLGKKAATRPGLSLVDEQKYWNELVHLCLFFISPHMLKRADVELMKRLHRLVPLVVVIAKADTMTADETRDYKTRVCEQLEAEGVQTFVFGQEMRTKVEDKHQREVNEGDFKPLYGGSKGDQPWAVISRPGTMINKGVWETDNPRHSDLPALRDLVLSEGGWERLKSDAVIKAEEEGRRRVREGTWRQALGRPLASLCRPSVKQLAVAVAVLLAAVLLPAHTARQREPLQRQLLALRDEHTLCAKARSSLEHEVTALREDYEHCTQVRKAVEEDLQTLNTRKKAVAKDSSWW
jgi:septin 7